ncbi:MAG: hypothetical protein AAF726_07600 [Planctomycetota bacterium]
MSLPLDFAAHLLLALTPTVAGMPPSDVHSGKESTEHFVIRYRPGSRAGAAVDRTAHMVELEYAEIVEKLALEGRVDESEPFEIYLYDDVGELQEISGVKGAGGFATGREVHIPWDNDQTRKHEIVHIAVAAMESKGDERRNMFFADGLANAVLEYVHGIPVHSVAAYERKRGSLPTLEELTSHPDFYAYLRENPGLNGYDVGGSYFLYLLRTYGPRKVMDYYHGKPIKKALGRSLAKIEKSWHEHLDAFPVRPELETLLMQRRGDGGEFTEFGPPEKNMPADVLGDPKDRTSVLADVVATDEVGTWKLEKDAARGSNPSGGDWSHVEVSGPKRGDCVLRMRAKTGSSCWGLKLRYGAGCEAILLGQGAFIYTPEGGIAHTDRVRLKGDTEVEIVLRVRRGRAEMYVDGALVLEAELQLEPSQIGFGLVGGEATIREFEVRDLDSGG